MNRNKEEKSRSNPTIKRSYSVLCSKCPPLLPRPLNLGRFVSRPTDSCKGKGRVEKVSEKPHQKCNNRPDLTFRPSKPRPVAKNGDRGETTDGRQRETKRRGRKHEDPAEPTIPLFIAIDMFCCCCVICEVVRVGRYYGFQNIQFPRLDLYRSGIFSPPSTNSRKSI